MSGTMTSVHSGLPGASEVVFMNEWMDEHTNERTTNTTGGSGCVDSPVSVSLVRTESCPGGPSVTNLTEVSKADSGIGNRHSHRKVPGLWGGGAELGQGPPGPYGSRGE